LFTPLKRKKISLLTSHQFSPKIDGDMKIIKRTIRKAIEHHLKRGKSILLLGPRQTGKSTLLTTFPATKTISFVDAHVRQRYEKEPTLLAGEIEVLFQETKKKSLIIIDEIQKVPHLLDTVQNLIDQKKAQFILTGSSARKLKRSGAVNLLPGRVVSMRLDPFSLQEYSKQSLEENLLYGTLPGIVAVSEKKDREIDLQSYVETYLEEEVRAEALVRNMGSFLRFLEYAGLEAGKIINYHKLSQEIGVNHTTIASYFEILEDCLIAERIDPITTSITRKKLTKSSRYLLFDLGIRRLCAAEGVKPGKIRMGELFEQYVGLELIRYARQSHAKIKIRFWRDADGPEVDWIIDKEKDLIPIEVKWTDSPSKRDTKNLDIFLREYKKAKQGYVVCQTPNPIQLSPRIQAISWKEIAKLFQNK